MMIDVHPVKCENWNDLEKLFENKGGPHHCWCMVWRNMIENTNRHNKADKKSSLKYYVEAYPVDSDSPSYRFMGFRQTFEKLGFVFRLKAGKRRNVMTLQLDV